MDHITAETAAGRALEPHLEQPHLEPGTMPSWPSSGAPSGPRHRADSSAAAASGLSLDGGSPASPRPRLAAVRDTAGAVLGTVMGVLPHVLHHIGLLAGAALVTGTTGNVVFLAVGLLFSLPLLRRIHRRFRTWVAPAVAVGVFTALFSVSAFVIGPALSGSARPAVTPTVTPAVPSAPAAPSAPRGPTVDGHAGHHR